VPNVRRYAPDIAKRFQEFGLKTELMQDAGRQAMLIEGRRRLRPVSERDAGDAHCNFFGDG